LIFSKRKEEWPTWIEKFLAKAKRSGIKDVLLRNVAISKSSDVIEEKNEEGKDMMKAVERNEIEFAELILSIDVSSSSRKVAFGIMKSCKTKDFEGVKFEV
jgi:hypothetical protein